MITLLEIACVLLSAVTMALSLAHALEYPGKKRLSRAHYLAVQPIYYPGFTIAGAAEPLLIPALAALLAMTASATGLFWLTAGALAAAIATHLLYWLLTAPVNKVWLSDEKLSASAERFFGASRPGGPQADWTVLRDRWETSHIWRALTAGLAFVLIVVRTAQ